MSVQTRRNYFSHSTRANPPDAISKRNYLQQQMVASVCDESISRKQTQNNTACRLMRGSLRIRGKPTIDTASQLSRCSQSFLAWTIRSIGERRWPRCCCRLSCCSSCCVVSTGLVRHATLHTCTATAAAAGVDQRMRHNMTC